MAGKVSWMRAIAGFRPIGSHTTIADMSSVQTLTPPNESARKILVQATAQDVRYTLDGTTPNATTGFVLGSQDPPLMIIVEKGLTLKLIEESSGAKLAYQWGQ